MSFTSEEIAATGWAWGKDQLPGPLSYAWAHEPISEWDDLVQELALRLALAHPERAALALGEGWRIPMEWSPELQRNVPIKEAVYSNTDWYGEIHVELCGGSTADDVWIDGGYRDCVVVPQLVDQPLARARRIAAAWQRIRAKEGGK